MSGSSDSEYRVSFRRPSGWVAFACAALLTVLLLGDAVLRGRPFDALLVAPWLLALCWGVFVLLAAPSVTATDDLLRVRGGLRVVEIPWSRVRAIRMRWQLEIALDDGTVVAATGAASRHLHINRREQPGDDQAATLELFRERARPTDLPVRRGWHIPTLLILAGIAAWAAWSLSVTGGIVTG
ncbi:MULTISPECIES: PH domain-containing protein [unclassified Microbacterium]|uniref:PH domain-containing protein n=1 Tax=Microbacterium TaxID=33882 RepID=UPI003B9EA126